MIIREAGFEQPNDKNGDSGQHEQQPLKPVTRTAKVIVAVDENIGKRLLYGEFKEAYVNENRGIDIEMRVEKPKLDCGHEWEEGLRVYICWRGHVVCQFHAHRCPSGRVVCEVPGCGKLYYGNWYSTFSKYLLDKTIGCRGLGRARNTGHEISVRRDVIH